MVFNVRVDFSKAQKSQTDEMIRRLYNIIFPNPFLMTVHFWLWLLLCDLSRVQANERAYMYKRTSVNFVSSFTCVCIAYLVWLVCTRYRS